MVYGCAGVSISSTDLVRENRLVLRYNLKHIVPGPVYSLPTRTISDNRLQRLMRQWSNQLGEDEYSVLGIVLDETFDDHQLRLGPRLQKRDAAIFKQIQRTSEATGLYMCFANIRRITKQVSNLYAMRSHTRRHVGFTSCMYNTPKDTIEITMRSFVELDGQRHLFESLQRSFHEANFLENHYFDNMNPNEKPDEEWEDRYTRTYEKTVRADIHMC